jgi:hypothetical protein
VTHGHLTIAKTWSPVSLVDFVVGGTTGSRMLTGLMVLLRSIGMICRGHEAVALENLALRQQIAAVMSPRTFCIFSREFSSFRRHGIANGQRS